MIRTKATTTSRSGPDRAMPAPIWAMFSAPVRP